MDIRNTLRSRHTRLAAIATAFALIAVPACSNSDDTASKDSGNTTTTAASDNSGSTGAVQGEIGKAQVELTHTMRLLWAQHMEWTYETVVAYVNDPKSDLTAASLDRLLQNQQDIGDAVGVYFGKDAGQKAAELLTEHIEGAVPVLDAARAGDDEVALNKAVQDWYDNSAEIGRTIAGLNPDNWNEDDVVAMLHDHIEQTVAYASDLIGGDDANAVEDYEKAKHHMLELADIMAQGIVAEFPDQFPVDDAITPSHMELSNTMRELWHEHMEWTYATVTAYIADPTSDLTKAQLDRLLKNQQDLGDAIGAYFGKDAGEKAAELLTEHIEGAVPVLDAAMAGDDEEALNKAVQDWYDNSAQIGRTIASLNPDNWPEDDVVAMLHDHIEQTVAYASDQIGGDYAASIVDYEKAQHHMLELADIMADGIVAAFPDQFTN